MAEGGIVGRLFGAEEGEEAEADVLGHPTADAVAMDLAGGSAEARAYLSDARRLIAIQTEHLHEQREVQLDHLKLRRVGERMRVAIQAFFVAVGAVIACGFVWMVWSAATDHGLVVEAFSVPPDLAARGLTGQVVAKQVLDRLAEMQAQTVTERAPDTYRNNWGEDLKVEIPETGVSIGDVQRVLRDTLGHETRISGEVYRTPTGLTVTARAGEEATKSFSGPDGDFDKLIGQAAEALYARTQPYRYSQYLEGTGHIPAARAALQALTGSGSAVERAWAHFGLGYLDQLDGNYDGDIVQCLSAVSQLKGFVIPWHSVAIAESAKQNMTTSLLYYHKLLSHPSDVRRSINQSDYNYEIITSEIGEGRIEGDYPKAIMQAGLLTESNKNEQVSEGMEDKADLLLHEHDLRGAMSVLQLLQTSDKVGHEAVMTDVYSTGKLPNSVALEQQTLDNLAQNAWARSILPQNGTPLLALAKAYTGDLTGAEATVAASPLDCDLCLRVRGEVASLAGDNVGAERWYDRAVARAPDLPQAYVGRGQARFRAGDLDGALSDARHAARLSPHDCDPYGLWGDVLARRRRWRAAKAKYEEALRYAPNWPAARRARDEVAARA